MDPPSFPRTSFRGRLDTTSKRRELLEFIKSSPEEVVDWVQDAKALRVIARTEIGFESMSCLADLTIRNGVENAGKLLARTYDWV